MGRHDFFIDVENAVSSKNLSLFPGELRGDRHPDANEVYFVKSIKVL